MRRIDRELPSGHPPLAPPGQIGVLLVNLGTPDATDYWSMRRYLSEFLSDKRVIEWPSAIWQPILQGIVLSVRPQKSGRAYRSIWNQERDEGPLRTFTRAQAEALANRVGGDGLHIDWAMRYGNPSIASRLEALKEKGCDRILVFALYPQYAAATTASVYDKTFDALKAMRWQPAIRTVPPFFDLDIYADALATTIRRQVETQGWDPDLVIMSYHGIPKSYFMKGDPYHCHCHKTTRLVREKLGWPEAKLRTTFQSRFGPEEWLQPYTDVTLKALPGEGIKKVMVASPAFISDCLETLEELGVEGREEFMEAGGEAYATVPCLNASEEAIDVIEHIVATELSGWAAIQPRAATSSSEAAE